MFVDWLTIRQRHGQAPVFAESYLENIDIDTGERRWGVYTRRQHQGSHNSSLRIRSDGETVEVSGNPSRWNRSENLFGVQTVDQAIEVFNEVLENLEIPTFAENPATMATASQRTCDGGFLEDGPVITRVDVTVNYRTGSPQKAWQALHALRSFQHLGRTAHDYGTTLLWGGKGKRYVSFKYYLKANEMEANLKRREIRDSPRLQKVIAWTKAQGIVRHEVCFKSMFLKRAGLHRPGSWTRQAMAMIMREYKLHERASATVTDMHEIRDVLVSEGLTPSQAERCQQAALAYLGGHDLRSAWSKATFYRYRSHLLLVGIDIAAELNVSALKFRITEIPMESIEAPAWYYVSEVRKDTRGSAAVEVRNENEPAILIA